MKKSLIFIFFLFLSLLSFTKVNADSINPDVFIKKCNPYEVTVRCNFKGSEPFVYKYNECTKFENHPDYRYLTGTGSSFGGYSIYCYKPSSILSAVSFLTTRILPLLATTLLIEYLVLLFFFNKSELTINLKKAFIIANLISYPLFYISSLFLSFIISTTFLIIILLEIFVILFESKYISKKISEIQYKKILKYSIIANLSSAIFGTLIFRIFEVIVIILPF